MSNLRTCDHDGDTRERSTARGTIKLLVGQAICVVAGAAMHIYLARALQPDLYGLLAVVTSIVIWWEDLGISTLRGATRQFVARAGEAWSNVAGTAVLTGLGLYAVMAVLSVLAASLTAGLLDDPNLVQYLWLFAPDIVLYPMFHVFATILNGRRRYSGYALSLVTYWVAKGTLVCTLVAVGFSVRGAIIGSMCASAVGLAVAWWWSGVGWPRSGFSARRLVGFGLPLVALSVCARLMINMDLWCVKAIVGSEESVGHYGAAKYAFTVAVMLPGVVGSAMSPTLAQALKRGNEKIKKELVCESFRFVFITMFGVAAVVVCTARPLVTLVFSDAYAAAAMPLIVLVIAALLFCLRNVTGSMLVASGKPLLSLAGVAPILRLNIGLNIWLVPIYGLVGAATATAITGLLMALITILLVRRELKVLFKPMSLLRTLIAAAVVYGIGQQVTTSGFMVIPEVLGLTSLYLILLVALGELTARDIEPLTFWR